MRKLEIDCRIRLIIGHLSPPNCDTVIDVGAGIGMLPALAPLVGSNGRIYSVGHIRGRSALQRRVNSTD
jgi:precorrin-6B methylase 2